MILQYLKIVMRNIRRDWSYFLIITVCLAAGLTLFAILTVEDDSYLESGYPAHKRTFYAQLTDPDSIKEKKRAAAWDYASFIQNYQKEMELYGEKVYDAGCFYVEGVEDIILQQASDELRNQKGLLFHSAGKDIPYYYGGSVLEHMEVSQSYYKYKNLTLLMGDRTPANEYEIVVKESLLKRIGLSVDDIESCSVKPILADDVISDIEYHIVNVIKDDKWSKEDDYDCFHWMSISRQYEDSFNPQVILAPGADIEAVNERLKARQFTNTRGDIKIPQLSSEYYYHHGGVKRSLLYSLALIIAVVSFLKRLVQSMNQSKRAKQIHICLGAGVWHILILQMLEVLITLIAAFLLSAYISSLLSEFLNGNLDNFSFEHYLALGDVVKFELLASAIILTVSTVVVLIATYFFIKNAYSGSIITHKERHLVTNIIICIELAVAVYGMTESLTHLGFSEQIYNPLPRDVKKRTFSLSIQSQRSIVEQYVPISQLVNELRSIPQVEEICCAQSWINSTMSINGTNFWLSQVDSSYFWFFLIPCQRFGVPETGDEIYLSRKLWDNLVAAGVDVTKPLEMNNFNMNIYDMNGNRIPGTSKKVVVAGIFERSFGAYDEAEEMLGNIGSAVTIDNTNYSFPYLRFSPGVTLEQAQQLVDDVVSRHLPETIKLKLNKLDTYQYEDDVKTSSSVFSTFAIICLLLAILSVQTSVSADANRRRKEVALRKINGAKARDIAALFVRPYGVIVLVAFTAGYLLSVVRTVKAVRGEGRTYLTLDSYVSWILPVTLAIIVAVVALTLLRRVRSIMRTNPADVINSE
jgi:ABC-type antimicrobial peptide transport system permease subunit